MYNAKQLLRKESFFGRYHDTIMFVFLLGIGIIILSIIGEPS